MFSEFSDGGTIGGGLNGGIGFSGWATRWWMASLPLFHRTMIDLPRTMECIEPSALISLACCLPSYSFASCHVTSTHPIHSLLFHHEQGSNATGDCCSKCYNEMLKKEGGSASPPVAAAAAPTQQPTTPTPVAITAAPTTTPPPVVEAPTTTNIEPTAAEPQKKKKKKKKMSYKNMMAGMLEQSGPRDAEMEKEGIKKVTGGGAFSKIDKI